MNRQTLLSRMLRTALKGGLVLGILGLGVAVAAYFMATKPVVQKKKPLQQAVFVEAVPVELTEARAVVTGMGTVVPSQQITLRARVSGTIIGLSSRFLPGGRLARGSEILRIDPSDYQVEVAKSESELRKALADLEMEKGQQLVARQELDLLMEASPDPVNGTDLALRKPQLLQAEAEVAIAEAELARARLELDRTVVKAPFNALVVDRQVDLGAQVGTQDSLATLVSTDEYWVEAAVAGERLPFVTGGISGRVRVVSQTGTGEWTGRIMHALGVLEEDSRMAKVLVSVQSPLDAPVPLMLGDYVRVEIEGRDLGPMFVLPRGALRRGDAVWVASNGTLEVRAVEIALRSGEQVYVRSGLQPGEAVILSDIAAPVPGMAVDVSNEAPTAGAEG